MVTHVGGLGGSLCLLASKLFIRTSEKTEVGAMRRLEIAQESSKRLQERSKRPQDAVKSAPRSLKTTSRAAQEASRRLQERSKRPQDVLKSDARALKTAPRALTGLKTLSRAFQDASEVGHSSRASLSALEAAQEVSTSSLLGSGAQRHPKWAFRNTFEEPVRFRSARFSKLRVD